MIMLSGETKLLEGEKKKWKAETRINCHSKVLRDTITDQDNSLSSQT